MKPILSLFIALLILSNDSFAQQNQVFIIPANKAYATPFVPGWPGVSIPVGYPEDKGIVSNWRDQNKSVVWYLYQTTGSYDFSFNDIVDKDKTLEFELTVTPTYPMVGFKNLKKKLIFKGTGKSDSLFVANIVVPNTGYFRYELRPISNPEGAIKINSLVFKSLKSNGQVNQTDYQSSPSVHLSFSTTAPTTKAYNWIYQEILVPKGGDPLATYYMSLGFYRGYMGIQTNSTTERRVLFSVWDSKDAENDKSITKQDFVSFVDKGKTTMINSFGNEGTGGQSYVKTAGWKTGEPIKFIMNVKALDNNSVLLSAWYKLEGQAWNYVATWRAPKEHRMFDGFYSFLENFGYTNGQLRREAYYYNAWGKEAATGKWINFNKVSFSNTDGKVGQRIDFEQGVSAKFADRFYMSSGGYTQTVKTANEIPLASKSFVIDLKPFEERILLALKNEVSNQEKFKKNK
ncbi:DUF3472 domain-containing protein [Pedobacter polaris]|uniref:DUF3472 domain-containing protein n=1 Tax=Pedobacter polaris TaxID=2571273 RepID=A0A4V5P147_9SPHI|nr:DUF3472 domain-containing protein [Pedobacter polaris]TKC08335.1 DUF3472 domain-containing protein [Pedobacter polaris]